MNILNLDLTILGVINQPFSPYINFLAIFINYSIYIFLLYLASVFLKHKDKNKLAHLIIVILIGYLIVLSLKYLIDRPRPYLSDEEFLGVFEKKDPSFPSAHAFISLIGYYFVSRTMKGFQKHIFTIYLLFLIPVSLMYIGIHYPSDILAGALIGIMLPRLLSEKISLKLIGLTKNLQLFKSR